MDDAFELIDVPATLVAACRKVGPYSEVGPAFDAICGWAGPLGLLAAPGRLLGLSWDDPRVTPPDRLRYDACVVIDRHQPLPDGIVARAIPACTFARAMVRGSFKLIAPAFQSLIAAVSARVADRGDLAWAWAPSVEVYHAAGPDLPEAEQLTEIRVAVMRLG